ncbi:hypothetical protein FNV43_RR10356 [Rhamnella rubrinervis]|uniref:TIR domain-containing protein n=1 Tax=Rhamnella rubrinervis TaxID=2594499 RepID=A0A8K0HD10_9ROSA|nr:hypothetical protein FNV43_RR10356 [Rhamnella rubrinervis]
MRGCHEGEPNAPFKHGVSHCAIFYLASRPREYNTLNAAVMVVKSINYSADGGNFREASSFIWAGQWADYLQQHKMETNPSPAKTFDVFLSFRGEDIRNDFTGRLSLALRKIGLFNIFKDDYALDEGKDIGPELMKAIEDSNCAVVVLSENYATSSLCLKELAKIVECMGDSGRIRTIFYHVNPSHVRYMISTDVEEQKQSSFWKTLEEHAKNPSHSKDLESWKNAFVKVANQSGHPVEPHTDEASFIEKFVADISRELSASVRNTDGLFGMNSRLLQLDSLVLQFFAAPQSSVTNRVCFIGIHGMSGIGKSTLARAYYKMMSHKFHGSSFLKDIRMVCEREPNSLENLQKKLLSNILKDYFIQIRNSDDGRDMIRSRFLHKKVLIVLDDVSNMNQLHELAWEDNWFGSGSIILVTTRDAGLLKSRKFTLYRAQSLNPSEALQLFSWKAFSMLEPPEEYRTLSEQAVKDADYLPLAIAMSGSRLRSRRASEWISALHRLKRFPDREMNAVLKISFDELDVVDQCIFLDIACFFSGFDKDYVIDILDSCDLHAQYGIYNLIDKSLLSIDQDGKILMSKLIEAMGKEIVREQDRNEPGRRSRIWDSGDLHQILKNEEGTSEVEAIVTSVDETKDYRFEGLSSMKRLRLLKIAADFPPKCDGLYDCDGPELSNNLMYLEWSGFPYSKLPSRFQFKLVQLKLQNSNIKKLWNNCTEPLYNLKVIDLSNSQSFTEFEDFKVFPKLEKLILEGCRRLSDIHPSIALLSRLIVLNLESCTSLKEFPEGINGLASLQTLKLAGCLKPEKLPDKMGQLKSLRNLSIEASVIKHLPSSIFLLENFQSVYCGKHWFYK